MRIRNALTRGWRLTALEPLNPSHVPARVRLEKTLKLGLAAFRSPATVKERRAHRGGGLYGDLVGGGASDEA